MKTIACAEIWGGTQGREEDLCTRGLTAALYSRSSDGLHGGDVYYFSVCAYDILTRIALADLRGHGEAVAKLSGWLYEQMQARMNDLDASQILSTLNQIVHGEGFRAMTTAVVLSYNQLDKRLHYAYAGHPPSLLRQQNGHWLPLEPAAETQPANLPLGVMPNIPFRQRYWQASAGERVFVFTDGLVECPSPSGEEFGDMQLAQSLARHANLNADEFRRALVLDLERFHGDPLDHDDCTFLVLDLR